MILDYMLTLIKSIYKMCSWQRCFSKMESQKFSCHQTHYPPVLHFRNQSFIPPSLLDVLGSKLSL